MFSNSLMVVVLERSFCMVSENYRREVCRCMSLIGISCTRIYFDLVSAVKNSCFRTLWKKCCFSGDGDYIVAGKMKFFWKKFSMILFLVEYL